MGRQSARISDDEFDRFREYFYKRTGIQFEHTKRYFVDSRLAECISTAGAKGFREYMMMLRFEDSGSEFQRLVNAMTVNETYFFREEYQFKCLVNGMLKEITEQKQDRQPIRIWSVPCSSGEEPYSIAIYLLEYWPGIQSWDVEIVSSDIDTEIIAQARRGHYSARSVQHLPESILRKYFRESNGGYQMVNELRDTVEFTRVNLMSTADIRDYRGFDVIFCRNMLIYFDDISRRQVAESFYDALRPGGFLCLGHSESMSRISSLFGVRKFPDALVYQKPRGGK